MNNAEIIWKYFEEKKFSPYAIAGIMGNMQAESGLQTNNLQNTYNTSLRMSDEQYTKAVDNGTYTNFIHDQAGYGLVQQTYWSLKEELYNLCKKRGKSISDIICQLDCLYQQLQKHNLINSLNSAASVRKASDIFLTKFERPKDQSESVQKIRANYGQEFYNQFANKMAKGGNGMKYSTSNPPLVCMQTQSTCYKGTSKMSIKGILWHSTGANNTTIKRYVQPSENDANYTKLIALIGTNPYKNDWNHTNVQAGLNAWIGTLADGSVAAVQTMPWDYKPWGCGSGSKGSCNNGWIQFEICEDGLTNKTYFDKIYKEACELTAYLCKLYNLNPKGTVSFGGTNVPVILCHQDSYRLGLGSNHGDVYHWFNRHGKTMDNVRQDVATLLGGKTAEEVIITTPTISPQGVLIRKGEASGRVRELQQNLIKLGYSCGPWGADGDFGNGTEMAVIKFQQDHKLEVDGIVGSETQQAIQKALKKLETPIPQTNVIYRVRKAWNDVSSQKGAYKVFENAKKLCDALGPDYKVFDNNGNIVYSINKARTPTSPISPPSDGVIKPKPRRSYATVMIGSSSKDERGQYRGGQVGDQTGKEVYILNWYYQNWNVVLRPTDEALAEKIACAMEDACDNNNIGYDQLERNSLYTEAKKVGLDISKISTPCECDCSSLVSICCICAGLPESYFYHGNMCTTYTLRNACLSTGKFSALTDNKYLTQKDYLKRGDILLNETQHVVVVLADGQKVENSAIKPTEIDVNNNTLNTSYLVKITAKTLNVRSQPNIDAPITTTITKGGVYTIVDERGGWGKLKSGAGWIALEYTQRL